MTTKKNRPLTTFLTTFNAMELGEGDINAGTNTLAAMLITLANLARPGSGIQTKSGNRIPVGCSLLISGSLSSSITTSNITAPIQLLQNNYTAHLKRLKDREAADTANGGFKDNTLPQTTSATSYTERAMIELLNPAFMPTDTREKHSDHFAYVLSSPPSPHLTDMIANPKVVIASKSTKTLEKQLNGCHLGYPLIVQGLTRSSGSDITNELYTAILDGTMTSGSDGEIIRGNLIITDPINTLGQLAKDASNGSAWMGRLLWLVDGDAGPGVCFNDAKGGAVCLGKVQARFQSAVALAFGKRLDIRKENPVIHEADMTAAQVSWVAFLKTQEEHIPGARSLLAALIFGTQELVRADALPANFKYYIEGLEAFARFLVTRMSNARNALVHAERIERMLHIRNVVLEKLTDGPHSPREIVRRSYKMPTGDCRDTLHALVAEGLVLQDGEHYSLSSSSSTHLTLEV